MTKPKITIDADIVLTMTIDEAKALAAITSYGAKAFLEGYYKQLGKSYVQPHEAGVYSLFDSIQSTLYPQLKQVDEILKKAELLNTMMEQIAQNRCYNQ